MPSGYLLLFHVEQMSSFLFFPQKVSMTHRNSKRLISVNPDPVQMTPKMLKFSGPFITWNVNLKIHVWDWVHRHRLYNIILGMHHMPGTLPSTLHIFNQLNPQLTLIPILKMEETKAWWGYMVNRWWNWDQNPGLMWHSNLCSWHFLLTTPG